MAALPKVHTKAFSEYLALKKISKLPIDLLPCIWFMYQNKANSVYFAE